MWPGDKKLRKVEQVTFLTLLVYYLPKSIYIYIYIYIHTPPHLTPGASFHFPMLPVGMISEAEVWRFGSAAPRS